MAVPSALKAALEDLMNRYLAADRSGEWQERNVLHGLVDVLDYASRISGESSSHYRAQKSLALVQGAMRVRREAFNNFADASGTEIEVDVFGSTSIDDVSALIEDVEVEITSAMWSRARGQRLGQSSARTLRMAVSALAAWADRESESAAPDTEAPR